MKVDVRKLPRIRDMQLSPLRNPLLDPQEIQLTRRYVRTSARQELLNPTTGVTTAVAAIHTIEDRDDASFVKVFAEGVRAAFGLTRTGYRVFVSVLAVYQDMNMKGGYAESVDLFWFGEGLNGKAIGISEPTFNRGLRELLANGFLYPRSPSSYWVNPALFFRGDRVAFVAEFAVVIVFDDPAAALLCEGEELQPAGKGQRGA